MPEYSDDSTIPDEAELWRRIPPRWFHFDKKLGRWRPASAAFEDDADGPMSVVVAAECRGPESMMVGHEGFGLASITVGLARQCNQIVAREPTDEEPAHAVVVGRKTDPISRKFACEARWIIPPPNTQATALP